MTLLLQLLLPLLATFQLTSGNIHTPKTSEELLEAIRISKPGDSIHLLPIIYNGNFTLPSDKVPSDAAITIDGNPDHPKSRDVATLKEDSGSFVVDIQGGKWVLQNLRIAGGSETTLKIHGNGHTLRNLQISKSGSQALSLEGNNNLLHTISAHGNKGGFGISVHGNRNSLQVLSIKGTTQALEIVGGLNNIGTLQINGGEKGVSLNGNWNKLQDIKIKHVDATGVLIYPGSKGTVVDTLSVDGARNGLLIAEGSSDGRYSTISIKNGLLQLSGDDNLFTVLTSRMGVNIFGCKNMFTIATIGELYENKGKCANNVVTPLTSMVKKRVDQPISTGRDE